MQDALVHDGVNGLIVMGTCGENNSLDPDEKRTVLKAAVEVVNGRVPVVTGVSEFDTRRAVAYARDAEKLGADGLMVLPAMVYVPKPEELIAHFRTVAEATSLPIMLYNNPPAYRVNIGADVLQALADVPNIVCRQGKRAGSAPLHRSHQRFGDRFDPLRRPRRRRARRPDARRQGLGLRPHQRLPAGIACSSSRPPNAATGKTARTIYRWFMPLLHLDAEHDLVQSIKLAEQIMGRGSERVRPPRLPLTGARRAEVTAMVEKAAATRPSLRSARRRRAAGARTSVAFFVGRVPV